MILIAIFSVFATGLTEEKVEESGSFELRRRVEAMRNIFCTPAIKETLPALLQVKLLCSSFADTFLTVNSAETAKRLFCAYTKELFCRFLLFCRKISMSSNHRPQPPVCRREENYLTINI